MINLDQAVLPRLADGHHKVVLESYETINNDKGGYLALKIKFADRTMQWNVFPSQFNYVSGLLQIQFKMEDTATTFRELLDMATENEFDIWTSVSAQYGRDYSLSKPAEVVNPDTLVI